MNPQLQRYGGYPQQAGRRPGQMSQTQHAQQQAQLALQQQQAQQRHIAEHQAAARRARKPTSKDIPENVEEFIIGDGVQEYKQLRDIEKRLDHAMQRKRVDINDSINRNVKRQRTMRIWISNTAKNQPWETPADDDGTFNFSEGSSEGTWRVKIEGRILDDGDEEDSEDGEDEDATMTDDPQSKKPSTPRKRFSHFFKSASVDFDKSSRLASDTSSQVEWKKQPGADFDCIEFERKGDENVNCTINLFRDEQPEKFRLSNALSQTLDMEEGEKAEVVMGIWDYVKAMGLQEDEEKRSIRCDDRLKQIFNRDSVFFPDIPNLIMTHLHPIPPIKLPYTIRVDQDYINPPPTPQDITSSSPPATTTDQPSPPGSKPTIYDIPLPTDDPLRAAILTLTQSPDTLKQLQHLVSLDDQLALLVQALSHSKAKHTFYRALARDPVGFMRMWMKSQRRDLEVLMGEAGRGGGEDGSGPEFARGGKDGVWGAGVVREAVRYKLASAQLKGTG